MDEETWYDVENERLRIYVYPTGVRYAVPNVTKVYLNDKGFHLLEVGEAEKKVVQPGWVAIEIDADGWSVL